MNKCKILKSMLTDNNTYIVPGVLECIGAKIAEKVGFKAISITGNGLSASVLGMPDISMMSLREVIDSSRNIAISTQIPVIGDADTGYGTALNVIRTVTEFERAGVAGIHIEDQQPPKKCAYYDTNKSLVSIEQQTAKIKAAVYAKNDPDFCIIARTDAFKISGMKETIFRSQQYAEAGADAIFVVGLQTAEEIASIKAALSVPLVINVNDGSELAAFDHEAMRSMGVKLVLYPATIRSAMVHSLSNVLSNLHCHGTSQAVLNQLSSLGELNDLLDLAKYQELEKEYVRM